MSKYKQLPNYLLFLFQLYFQNFTLYQSNTITHFLSYFKILILILSSQTSTNNLITPVLSQCILLCYRQRRLYAISSIQSAVATVCTITLLTPRLLFILFNYIYHLKSTQSLSTNKSYMSILLLCKIEVTISLQNTLILSFSSSRATNSYTILQSITISRFISLFSY